MRKDKEANKAYQRKWYAANRQLQITRNNENRKRKRKWYREYKKTLKCIKCDENHPATLDFHHRNSQEKDRDIREMVADNCSIEKIQKEIAKCDVLCANCHRKLHYNKRIAIIQ